MSELLIHHALFERVEDRTPVCRRSATLRCMEPSLLSLLDPLPYLTTRTVWRLVPHEICPQMVQIIPWSLVPPLWTLVPHHGVAPWSLVPQSNSSL